MISVIVTTYCRAPEIVERALKSVLSQTYQDMEIILVDDSNPDFPLRERVRETALRLDERIKYIPHETCMGACAARNTGIQAAKGELLAFLDDDDEWLPEKIERQLALFGSDEIALVYCGFWVVDETTDQIYQIQYQKYRGEIYANLLQYNCVGSSSFPLIRKEALLAIGGFDVEMKASQDLDTWLRLSQKYRIDFVDAPLVRYHIHAGEQITSNPKNKIAGYERLIEKNMAYLETHKAIYSLRLLLLVPYLAMDRQMLKALRVLAKAFFLNPKDIKTHFLYFGKAIKARMLYSSGEERKNGRRKAN